MLCDIVGALDTCGIKYNVITYRDARIILHDDIVIRWNQELRFECEFNKENYYLMRFMDGEFVSQKLRSGYAG